MKSHCISALGAIGLALCLGCGGSSAPAETTTPEPVAAAPVEAGTETEMAEATEDQAAEAAPALSATALGPQISAQAVRFNFKPSFKVKKVYLAGSFNSWNPSNDEYLLKDEDGDGIYSITVPLSSGQYQYKFVIDGQWTKDPYAPASKPDGYGAYNGAFDVP